MKKFILLCTLLSVAAPSFSKCSDYSSAEEVVRAYKNGETQLDRDGDCYACETTFNAYVCGDDKPKAVKKKASKTTKKVTSKKETE